MIFYVTTEQTLAQFPDLLDIALLPEITIYAVSLTSAVITMGNNEIVNVPINSLGSNLYTIETKVPGILTLTDIDGSIDVTLHLDFINKTAFYSWLQRNQLLYLADIFESKSLEQLKRFTLFARDINNYIGTYRVIDIVMKLLNIATYHLEREWVHKTSGVKQWLQMTDDSLINPLEEYAPTGNLKLFYSANGVIFTREEILKVVRHVIPAVNYIEDAESSFVLMTSSPLYVASQQTETAFPQMNMNALLSCSNVYKVRDINGVLYGSLTVNSDYPFVLRYKVPGEPIREFYSSKGLIEVLMQIPGLSQGSYSNPSVAVSLYMLMPNHIIKTISGTIPCITDVTELSTQTVTWSDFNHNDFNEQDFH